MNFNSDEERLLFATVRIESISENNSVCSIGTGFLLMDRVVEDGSKVYIVSNKHVLLASNRFRIGFSVKKPECAEPELGVVKYYSFTYVDSFIELHPDPDVDIAIIDVTGFIAKYNNQIYFRALRNDMLATCEEDVLNVAQSVFFVGYPDGRYDANTNLPLVRSAVIASHPHLNFNGVKAFVIDGQVFPGSSGSPVIINPFKEIWSSGYDPKDAPKNMLLGIVSQTMVRNNKLQVLDSSQIKNAKVQEVIGLGIVFKSSAIKELLGIAADKYFGGMTNDEFGLFCQETD